MTMRALSYALAASTALVLASPASAAELVTNGDFETGSLSGWTQVGSTTFNGVATGYGVGGSNGAFFGPVGSTGGISQALATIAGQTYTLSFALLSDGGTPNSFSVLFGGSNPLSLTNAPAFGYTTYSYNLLATSASTNLQFDFRDDPGFWGLDNVSVTAAVPEPATWAMMLLGFGMMGGMLRYRRRSTKVAFT